jgi:hypothetical protein
MSPVLTAEHFGWLRQLDAGTRAKARRQSAVFSIEKLRAAVVAERP